MSLYYIYFNRTAKRFIKNEFFFSILDLSSHKELYITNRHDRDIDTKYNDRRSPNDHRSRTTHNVKLEPSRVANVYKLEYRFNVCCRMFRIRNGIEKK